MLRCNFFTHHPALPRESLSPVASHHFLAYCSNPGSLLFLTGWHSVFPRTLSCPHNELDSSKLRVGQQRVTMEMTISSQAFHVWGRGRNKSYRNKVQHVTTLSNQSAESVHCVSIQIGISFRGGDRLVFVWQ